MPKVKTKVYSGSKERTMESMFQVSDNTLKELGMEVTTQYLDKTLIECKGKPPAGSPLGKENIVTIYKEGDQIFIKFTYAMEDPDAFWNLFEANLQIYGASTTEIEHKAKIIALICKTIRGMGTQVDEEEAWDFLYNFEKSFQRLPTEEEITPIAMDFIKIQDENGQTVQANEAFVGEKSVTLNEVPIVDEIQPIQQDGIQITPTDALKEIIKEIPTIDPGTLKFYLSLIDSLTLTDQEHLVTKIKAIENDLNKVPYLMDDERIKIRKEVMELSTEKRRERLLKIIKERQKNEASYMAKYVEQQIKNDLTKLTYLSRENISDIMSVILTMTFDQKKKIVEVVNSIEQKFNEYAAQGIVFTDFEKHNHRLELIRLEEKERIEQLEKIGENVRINKVKDILFTEIPQLQFEDNKELIKQLMWLNENEIRQRIVKMKADIEKQSKERKKIFEGTSAGSTCKKCGWPMGSMSKKCVRCGWSTDDWFQI